MENDRGNKDLELSKAKIGQPASFPFNASFLLKEPNSSLPNSIVAKAKKGCVVWGTMDIPPRQQTTVTFTKVDRDDEGWFHPPNIVRLPEEGYYALMAFSDIYGKGATPPFDFQIALMSKTIRGQIGVVTAHLPKGFLPGVSCPGMIFYPQGSSTVPDELTMMVFHNNKDTLLGVINVLLVAYLGD